MDVSPPAFSQAAIIAASASPMGDADAMGAVGASNTAVIAAATKLSSARPTTLLT
ncbi:hypothetical protein MBOU_19140 [Mycobacterium bourgelatii]|uniref:Uncharacterized protein n=1 Tax=Mycobacterium bourgelatii TaxID=1273442 RepID=A0A7I9YMT2_MYCBU|nr:hypothetical protein MBOU_19140 [Mycobacterium bourgelatii]